MDDDDRGTSHAQAVALSRPARFAGSTLLTGTAKR